MRLKHAHSPLSASTIEGVALTFDNQALLEGDLVVIVWRYLPSEDQWVNVAQTTLDASQPVVGTEAWGRVAGALLTTAERSGREASSPF